MFATRFAPSPTGLLHLGHAYSALVAHDVARGMGGQFLLRFDDLDFGRVRPEYRISIYTDLDWLGLELDDRAVLQSDRTVLYLAALERLLAMNLIYPCFCSRADIAASVTAPHGPEGPIYPGTCRSLERSAADDRIAAGEAPAWRLDTTRAMQRMPALHWQDSDAGRVMGEPRIFGDVVLARRDGAFAYHLASTIDDAEMGISHVVRGADLFAATHVHRLLQALLDLPSPLYRHHRLIGDAVGKRLAKRDDAACIASLRDSGMDPGQLIDNLRQSALPLGYCWLDA